VAAIFSSLKEEYIRRIDASGSVEEVHQQVMQEVEKVLSKKELATYGTGCGKQPDKD
jgi:thymidylate kinase